MKISIIIPTYNGWDLVEICLNSIYMQNNAPDVEVLIIDNGSEVRAEDVFVAGLPKNIIIIRLDENLGFSKAVNYGIKQASGEWVFVLNNDTRLGANCLKSVMESLLDYPGYASYALMVYDWDLPNSLQSVGLMFSIKGYGNRSHVIMSDFQNLKQPVDVFGPCGVAAIYHRSVLAKVHKVYTYPQYNPRVRCI